jgi:hypothetical protein
MTQIETPQTLGALVDALIEAETKGRDFLLEMVESFVYIPAIADIWRDLMLDEAAHLHRLREFRDRMTPDLAGQLIGQRSIEQAESVEKILDEARLRDIATLDDAYNLLTEYELSGHHEYVEGLTDVSLDDVERLLQTRPKEKHGLPKLKPLLAKFGGRELIKSLYALRPSVGSLPARFRKCGG